MGHWTPTGVEPKDYDDDDVVNEHVSKSLLQKQPFIIAHFVHHCTLKQAVS